MREQRGGDFEVNIIGKDELKTIQTYFLKPATRAFKFIYK
ncbi:MAG: hypothetical protein ACI8ZN_001252 [Bacteroidia bacterium]|jgi:hypothetical protein